MKRDKENGELSASNFYFKCLNHKLSPEDASTGNYVPDTVLNEDIRNYIQNQVRVIAVFRTSPQSVVFDEITYVAKDMDLSMIKFPKEYRQVLKVINVDKNLLFSVDN